MRVFAERFCELFQPAIQPDPVLRQRLRERAIADGHVDSTPAGSKNSTRASGPSPTVADQISVFKILFEGGFQSEAWADACRFRDKGKALKRHVDPALERARTELDEHLLRSHIEAGASKLVVERITDVVGSTSLATKTQLDAFRTLDVDAPLATAFVDFLYDVGGQARGPLDRLRLALAKHGLKNVPWTVLTAARAFLAPDAHVFVRPSAFRAQAKLLAPNFKLPSVPTPDAYARCLEMAIGLRNELVKAGLHPRDLLDVAEFIRVTLSRSQQDELRGAMTERMRGGDKPVH